MKLNKSRAVRSSAQTVGKAEVRHWARGASRVVNMSGTYHTFALWDRREAMGYEPSSITMAPFRGAGRARKCSTEDHSRAGGESARAGVPLCSMDVAFLAGHWGGNRPRLWCCTWMTPALPGLHLSVCSEHTWKSCLCFSTSTTLKLRLKRRQGKPWQEQPLLSLTF